MGNDSLNINSLLNIDITIDNKSSNEEDNESHIMSIIKIKSNYKVFTIFTFEELKKG